MTACVVSSSIFLLMFVADPDQVQLSTKLLWLLNTLETLNHQCPDSYSTNYFGRQCFTAVIALSFRFSAELPQTFLSNYLLIVENIPKYFSSGHMFTPIIFKPAEHILIPSKMSPTVLTYGH